MSGSMSSVSAPKIPRDKENDYRETIAATRRRFVIDRTGAALDHVGQYSIDPAVLPGNVENFFGVAQVPMGLAGPLLIDGEHARGEFLIPLATSEGTLVASYSRGMKVLNLCGGVRTTIIADAMQRAPAFVFNDARASRDFVRWIE